MSFMPSTAMGCLSGLIFVFFILLQPIPFSDERIDEYILKNPVPVGIKVFNP